MITVWRVAKTRYMAPAFDGEGAWRLGGRWNSRGVRVAYAAQSISLAALEVLAGLTRTSVLESYSAVSAAFEPSDIETFPPAALPRNWRRYPAPPELQALGDRWVAEGRSLVLQVPSVMIPNEANFLLNPAHPAFASVTISDPVPFEFDPRLTRSMRPS